MPIHYASSLDVAPEPRAADFFVSWPRKPSQKQLISALRGSFAVALAIEDDQVIGFGNAISDGVTTAFIPWLEVVPAYQSRGIGTTLLSRLTAALDSMYSIDLVCDASMIDYYASRGMSELSGMGIRHPGRLRGSASPGQGA